MGFTQIAWIFFVVGNIYIANDKKGTGLLWLLFGMVTFALGMFAKWIRSGL